MKQVELKKTITERSSIKVYFLIAFHEHLYDDGLIYIAEGLKDLNISFYANRNYWLTDLNGTFLFNYCKDFDPCDADVVILSNNWTQFINPITFIEKIQPIPEWVFLSKRKFSTVYIDNMDGYNTFSYTSEARKFDFILRSKTNHRTFNHPNMYPWVLGFQNRILEEKLDISIQEKKFKIAVNFNFSHHYEHQLRAFAKKNILGKLDKKLINNFKSDQTAPHHSFSKLMWQQTFKKHNPSYFNNIEKTLMVASFCGDMIPGLPFNPANYLVGGKKAKIRKSLYLGLSFLGRKENRIIQWDSWRFWESLALGSVPIHVDLEKYGVELPIKPENWVHYIGIDLNNINRDLDRIFDDKNKIYEIARAGESWVLNNYSPAASVNRLIKLLNL